MFDGRGGSDTIEVDFDYGHGRSRVDLLRNTVKVGKYHARIPSIENVAASGTIIGDAHANRLVGGAGPDLIRGSGGNDVIIGHGGDDDLDGGTGSNTIDGGTGDDRCVHPSSGPRVTRCEGPATAA